MNPNRITAKAKILNKMASMLLGKLTTTEIEEVTKFAADNDLLPFLQEELEDLNKILLSKAEHAEFE